MADTIELNSVNTTQGVTNVTCYDMLHSEVTFPFDGLFMNKEHLVLAVDGEISTAMALTKEQRNTILYANKSLR